MFDPRVGGALTTPFLRELADVSALSSDARLTCTVDQLDDALQSSRAVPLVAADLVSAIWSTRPDAESPAWAPVDWLIVKKLDWECTVPLLMGQRYSPTFRSPMDGGVFYPATKALNGLFA